MHCLLIHQPHKQLFDKPLAIAAQEIVDVILCVRIRIGPEEERQSADTDILLRYFETTVYNIRRDD